MGKHRSADNKLISRNLRKLHRITYNAPPRGNTAPQIPRPVTNSKNQYK